MAAVSGESNQSVAALLGILPEEGRECHKRSREREAGT